jgi:hypothetical protein
MSPRGQAFVHPARAAPRSSIFARVVRGGLITALLAAGLLAAGCGGGAKQDENEAAGTYRLEVVSASFPEDQRLAESATMKITVRNADDRVVPHIAVTVETAPESEGGASQAFARRVEDPQLADPSRPIWIVDSEPSEAQVAHTNTWALPRIKPGETAEFEWKVTAVKGGDYTIDYSVFPGLDGKAELAEGARTEGSFEVSIDDTPPESRVDEDGNVVREPS